MKRKYLTLAEVCSLLHISVGTGRNRLYKGEDMPKYAKVGRRLLFPEDLFESWIESYVKESVEVGVKNEYR